MYVYIYIYTVYTLYIHVCVRIHTYIYVYIHVYDTNRKTSQSSRESVGRHSFCVQQRYPTSNVMENMIGIPNKNVMNKTKS